MAPWISHYHPPESTVWQGRADSPAHACFFQVIQLLDLKESLPVIDHFPAFALLGFRCDEGIRRNFGRTGAAEGPLAIRTALARLAVQTQPLTCFDAGDILCTDSDLESAQHALGEAVSLLLRQGITPIVLGGGHEVAWGHYQGIAKYSVQESLGIINFDAHFDMRPLLPDHQGSSGTPFLQIAEAHRATQRRFDYNCIGIQRAGNVRALFETAKRYDTHIFLAEELHQSRYEKCIDFVSEVINRNQLIYLSLCLDVFAAPYAPGVSAPQTLGLTPWQVLPFIRQLAASGKVISYDIAELSPPYDVDGRTAKLAAHCVYDIIHYHKNRKSSWD